MGGCSDGERSGGENHDDIIISNVPIDWAKRAKILLNSFHTRHLLVSTPSWIVPSAGRFVSQPLLPAMMVTGRQVRVTTLAASTDGDWPAGLSNDLCCQPNPISINQSLLECITSENEHIVGTHHKTNLAHRIASKDGLKWFVWLWI